MTNLNFLFLHSNSITSWDNMTDISSITSLLHLTLYSNPVASIPGYRHYMINSCSSLLALDEYVITDEERFEDASFGSRFRALNRYMKIYAPDFVEHLTAEKHIFNMEVDIYRLKRIYERNSPVIRVQTMFRGYRVRNDYANFFSKRKSAIIKIQKVIRGWLMRFNIKKELKEMLKEKHIEFLLMTNQEIAERWAGIKIARVLGRKLKERKRRRLELRSVLLM
jgi:hypothetical protein